jgi:ubiquinone/menaquinone biosynthesis C-methylase UbiE
MAIPRVLEPEVMDEAEEASDYDAMDFSATDRLFAERAAELGAHAQLIADIGSGNAKIPLMMIELLPAAAQVSAVEMSVEMLKVAARNRERAGVSSFRMPLLIGDAKRLPWADGELDMLTSNSLVHHIPDPRTFFREIKRVMKPGAPILIRDLMRPDSDATLEQLVKTHAANWNALQNKLFSDSLHAALTLKEIRSMLDECGLDDVMVSQITDRHWSSERGATRRP